jgi:hypothetical protein
MCAAVWGCYGARHSDERNPVKLFPDHRDSDGALRSIYGVPTKWIAVAMIALLVGYRLFAGPIF